MTTAQVAADIAQVGTAAAPLLQPHHVALHVDDKLDKEISSREVSRQENKDASDVDAFTRFLDHVYVKRLKLLVLVLGVAYSDIAVDAYNGYSLFQSGQSHYGAAMLSLLFVPNFLTWNFLWVNGMTQLKHLPIILLQLGPLNGFVTSWETGEPTGDLFWYTASEGLMEATFTGVLTAYFTTFGGNIPSTFYVGVASSYVSISKTAVSMNFFLHGKIGIMTKCLEFFSRFVEVSLRLSSLACFAYLMKDRDSVDAAVDKHTNTQTAILAWLLLSLASNATMINMAEPNCPLSVKAFFGVILIFVSPPEFLKFFTAMRRPFELFRYIETIVMVVLAVSPLQINPRLWDLCEQAPFVVWTFSISFAVMTIKMILRCLSSFWKHVCQAQHEYSRVAEDDGDSKLARAQRTQENFYKIIASGDLLMTNLFVNLEGASLKDDSVVTLLAYRYLSHACKWLERKGMRTMEEVVENPFVNDSTLRMACQSNNDSWTLQNYLDCGLPAKYLKEGFAAKQLSSTFSLQELKDAGCTVVDLYQTGCSPLELKEVVFGSKEMELQDVKALHDIGLTWKELKDAGCSAAMLFAEGCSEEQLLNSCSPPQSDTEAYELWQKEVAFVIEAAHQRKIEEYERYPEEEQKLIQAVFVTDRNLLMARLQFTEEADKATTKRERDALLETVVRKRDDLIKSLRRIDSKIFPEEHMRMTNMVYMLQGLVLTAQDFDRWALELKIYATPGGAFKAVCGGKEMQLGNSFPLRKFCQSMSRKVLEARVAIFEAWTSGRIILISGPAGSGKTETIKQICLELGWKSQSINCSGDMTPKQLESYSTLTDGRVLVFDEFNRLPLELMEETFMNMLPSMKNPIAFTMNAGYAGRQEVPQSLKAKCVHVEFPLPQSDEMKTVLEVMLFASGFASGDVLAEKVVTIFDACRKSLSKQVVYDLGMRSRQGVIRNAAARLAKDETVQGEAVVMQKSLLLLGFMMIDDDRKILIDILQKAFGQTIDASCYDRRNVDLVSELLQTRHATLLNGVALEDVSKAIDGLRIRATDAQANLISVPESGSIAGLSLKEFENCFATAMSKQREHATWIVVRLGDKPVRDLIFIFESLNSTLDDNKVYVLEDGSRLPLYDGKIIFLAGEQVMSIASPAVISRMGCVWARSNRW